MFTAITVYLAGFAVVGSLLAIWISYRSYSLIRARHQHKTLEKRLLALEVDAADLADQLQKLAILAKRKAGREAVRAHRAKQKAEHTEEESDADWVKRTNRELTLRR